MAYDISESSVCGRICQICTFDESVTWFEDVGDFVVDPLPADFTPAEVCGTCGAVYGPDGEHDPERSRIYAERLARVELMSHEERFAFLLQAQRDADAARLS
jgi:hypothetical protein